MRLPGPKDLIRHGRGKSRTPLKLSLRPPFGVAQINATGCWVKPPSSGGRFVHDDCALWTSDRRHERTLAFRRLNSTGVRRRNGGSIDDQATPRPRRISQEEIAGGSISRRGHGRILRPRAMYSRKDGAVEGASIGLGGRRYGFWPRQAERWPVADITSRRLRWLLKGTVCAAVGNFRT
jgi:hypothetical protein